MRNRLEGGATHLSRRTRETVHQVVHTTVEAAGSIPFFSHRETGFYLRNRRARQRDIVAILRERVFNPQTRTHHFVTDYQVDNSVYPLAARELNNPALAPEPIRHLVPAIGYLGSIIDAAALRGDKAAQTLRFTGVETYTRNRLLELEFVIASEFPDLAIPSERHIIATLVKSGIRLGEVTAFISTGGIGEFVGLLIKQGLLTGGKEAMKAAGSRAGRRLPLIARAGEIIDTTRRRIEGAIVLPEVLEGGEWVPVHDTQALLKTQLRTFLQHPERLQKLGVSFNLPTATVEQILQSDDALDLLAQAMFVALANTQNYQPRITEHYRQAADIAATEIYLFRLQQLRAYYQRQEPPRRQ